MEFDAGGKQLILGSSGGVVRRADAATGKVLRRFAAPGDKIPVGVFSPGCRLVAYLAEGDAEVRLWDVVAGKELRRFKAGEETLPVLFGPGGKLLAILDGSSQPFREGPERTLRLWDTTTGQPLRSLALAATTVVFSPNGKVIALASEGTISVCEVATGKERCRLRAPASGLEDLAFSRDGRWLAAGGSDETVRVWDVLAPEGSELYRGLAGHSGSVRALAFSPDGKRLASGSTDQTVRLWDLTTGEPLRRLEGHRGAVLALAFAADGKRLVSGSDDSTALVWDLEAVPKPKLPTGALRELEALWTDLGREDSDIAFAAHRALAHRSAEAVSFLTEKLVPVAAADPAVVAKHIKDLGSRRFAVRERAVRNLGKLEGQVEPALRKALAARPDAEVVKRLQSLLDRLAQPALTGEELRMSRALELLEQLGTAGARRLLGALAGGAPGMRLTREAREALERLASRDK